MLDENSMEKNIAAAAQNVKERDYWLEKLSGDWEKVSFPYDRSNDGGTDRARFTFELPPATAAALIKLANGSDYRVFMILLAGLNALLHKYTGKKDIIIGSPIYKQEDEGEFINTVLALRCGFDAEASFKDLLLTARTVISEAVDHQNYPIDSILFKLGFRDGGDDFPLFDVVLLLENIQNKNYLKDLRPGMIFSFARDGEALTCTLDYNAGRYREAMVKQLLSHLSKLLSGAVGAVDTPLPALDILSEEEKTQLVTDFNGPETDGPDPKTMVQLFEEQVLTSGDRTAVIGMADTPSATYNELNEAANRIAHMLTDRGAGPGSVIAVVMESSVRRIAAVLGILKAGAAYLPFDPEFPQERVLSILDDTGVSFVLTDEALLDRLSFTALADIKAGSAEPIRTAPREQITDFDALPFPDRTLVDYGKYHQYIGEAMAKHKVMLQATRGCPYHCAFCHKIWPKRHVRRSPENIFEEIHYSYKAGVRRFAFIDDIFNMDRDGSAELFRNIIRHKLDLQLFFCNGLRADILTKEYIDLMVEAGTVNIDTALETGSPRLQKLIRKNLNLDKFCENIHYITQKHPQVILEMEMMLGFPTETEEEAMMTLDLLKSLKWVHFPNLHVLKIFPTSDMAKLAVEHGVKEELIQRSTHLAFHELPETLPFSKAFAREFQARFMNEYFLSKERLKHVLPMQVKVLAEDELLDKYDSYLPMEVKCVDDIFDFADISKEEMGPVEFPPEGWKAVPDYNEKVARFFPVKTASPDAFRLLLLDISLMFSSRKENMIHNQSDEPLGLMYLLTHLNKTYGDRVDGEIHKTGVDFDGFEQLKDIVTRFKPDLIGIRTLSYYKEFFHEITAYIKRLGVSAPVVSGGPYATSDYKFVLQDPNLDLVVLGEGELTFTDLVGKMMDNDHRLPDADVLKTINGIAFLDPEDRARLLTNRREVLPLDRLAADIARRPADNPSRQRGHPARTVRPDDLLYLIATSGSTGKPKTVMMEHRNLANLLDWQERYTDIDFSGGVLQFASIGFDVSAQEIFSTLTAGGTLCLVSADMKTDVLGLFQRIEANDVRVLFLPPSYLKMVFSEPDYAALFPKCVRHIIAAGEQLVVPERLREHMKQHGVYLHNHYGPTETHVVTSLTVGPGEEVPELPSIGRPIADTGIYILDEARRLMPAGAAGELYISGANVARGYHNRVDLTAQRFLPDPFVPGRRMYRTGDLARRVYPSKTGNDAPVIEFLGRIDRQVQVRGFRIELEEIEKQLLDIDGVKAAAVTDRQDDAGDTYLCAYVTTDSEDTVDRLRDILSLSLPEYMLPQYFVRLNKIPLTANGKTDRKALPAPEVKSDRAYTAPRNAVEETFTRIWCEALGADKDHAGIDDNFFEMGGNSLKATILITKIHKAFDTKVTLGEIFAEPTIRGLAECVKGAESDTFNAIEPAAEQDYYPLSSAQKRLYIQHQAIPDNTSYNMPAYFILEGPLDRERLERVFKQLIARHESLRTSFVMLEDGPMQKIHEPGDIDFEIEYHDSAAKNTKDHEGIDGFVRAFDLSAAPILRVGLEKTAEDEHILMVDMHHIISDGTSFGVMSREFMQLYNGEAPPPLTIQYKDFAQWQNRLLASPGIEKQERYWLDRFSGEIPVLNLSTDFPRPETRGYKGWGISHDLSPELSAAIQQLVLGSGTTLHVVTLAVYNILLAKYCGQEDIVVGTGVAGRRHADLEHVIGLFINMLVMRNRPAGDKTFKRFLAEVNENALNAYDNQDYQFDELVRKLDLQGNPARNPLFDVVFQTQNMEIPPVEVEGLTLRPYDKEFSASHFDLVVYVWEEDDIIRMRFLYDQALFKETTLREMAVHFTEIAEQALENPDIPLREIEISTRFEPARSKMAEQETQFQF